MRLLLLSFTLLVVCKANEDRPIVSTSLGDIRGSYKQSDNGKRYSAFEGIPFARPPIGALRFQDPEPAEGWSGVWDATKTYTCMQYSMFQLGGMPTGLAGDEDCLYINVYVPREKIGSSEKLDVIAHVHGGAFMVGSGHFYTKEKDFMEKDVILVTFNYRLGLLGFLSTGDKSLPGNYGLKDQSMALEWIQEHISKFGGNPKSVTLTGISAGSASVHYHYMSPWSKGLFARGSAQSGCVLNPWTLQENPLTKVKQLGALVGCEEESNQKLVDCIRSRPATLLMERTPAFYGSSNAPLVPFGPVIDKGSAKPFIPDHPYFLMTQGKIVNDVPLIFSYAADEGLPFSALNIAEIPNLNEDWEKVAAYVLDFNNTLAKSVWGSTAREVKEFYMGDKEISMENLKEYTKMLGDRLFMFDGETAIRLHAKHSKSPVYVYLINYGPTDPNAQGYQGVWHASDIIYLFKIAYTPEMDLESDEVKKIQTKFMDLFVSYAKEGVPKVKEVEFTPTTHDKLTFLNINGPEGWTMDSVEELSPRAFWKQLGLMENQNIVLVKDEL